jgi:hypothetical protein
VHFVVEKVQKALTLIVFQQQVVFLSFGASIFVLSSILIVAFSLIESVGAE